MGIDHGLAYVSGGIVLRVQVLPAAVGPEQRVLYEVFGAGPIAGEHVPEAHEGDISTNHEGVEVGARVTNGSAAVHQRHRVTTIRSFG